MRSLRVALVVALLGAAVTTAQAGASGAGLQQLAGVTTATVASSARVQVTLARSQTWIPQWDGSLKGWSVEGRGRIIGVELSSLDGSYGFAQLRVAPCFSRGCTPHDPRAREYIGGFWGDVHWNPKTGAFTLPVGRYWVAVLTDGSPVTVTMNFPRLASRRHLDVNHAYAGAQITSPTTDVVGANGTGVVVRSGAGGGVASPVVLLAQVHVSTTGPGVDDENDWCTYGPNGPPGGQVEPGCPGADSIVDVGGTYLNLHSDSMSWGLSVGPSGVKNAAYRVYQGDIEYGAELIRNAHDSFLFGGVPG